MTQLKELLDEEARRLTVDPEALESLIRTGERRQRNRRVATAVFAFAVFAAVMVLIVGALGSDRSAPADRTPKGAFHHNGDIVVRVGVSEGRGAILQIDPTTGDEAAVPVVASARHLVWPPATSGRSTDFSWSPDGSRLAYVWSNEVWVLDVASGGSTKIATCDAGCTIAWSPDGSDIAYTHGQALMLVNADDLGRRVITTFHTDAAGVAAWSPDGQQIALRLSGQLYTIGRDGSDLQRLAVAVWSVAWSPDGSRIAYLDQPNCDHRSECPITVNTVNVDGSNATEVLRAGACYCLGFAPGLAWSPDGSELALVIPGPADQPDGLYVANADGTDLRLVREGAWGSPAWQPKP